MEQIWWKACDEVYAVKYRSYIVDPDGSERVDESYLTFSSIDGFAAMVELVKDRRFYLNGRSLKALTGPDLYGRVVLEGGKVIYLLSKVFFGQQTPEEQAEVAMKDRALQFEQGLVRIWTTESLAAEWRVLRREMAHRGGHYTNASVPVGN